VSAAPNGTSARPFQVTVAFQGASVGNAHAIEIQPGAAASSAEHPAAGDGDAVPPGAGGSVPSVQQILGSVGSAARVRHARWVKFTTSRPKQLRRAPKH
jgi:hypothetical protein